MLVSDTYAERDQTILGMSQLPNDERSKEERSKEGQKVEVSWRVGLLMALISVVLALLAMETFLRLRGRHDPVPRCRRPELYGADDRFGYTLHPNLKTSYRYPEQDPRTLKIISNAQGFRDARALDDVDERPALLMVGDSFVFGEGVEAEERFSDLIAKQHPEWRVHNMGMTGWGVDLMLRAVEALGEKAKPRAILLNIYTDDLRRARPYYAGAGFYLPKFTLEGGRLSSIEAPRPAWWERPHLVQVLLKAMKARRWGDTPHLKPEDRALHEALLDRFGALARERGLKLGISFLPGWDDTAWDKERRRWLLDYCESRKLPFTDLSAPIHERGMDLFLKGNWHYNPEGHAVVARALEPMVRSLMDQP